MPRVGSGIYEIPDGTHGVENTTIESAKYNSYVDDVAIDLNLARPIIAGGTGANNAADALVALKGEQTFQLVTNYDAHLFVSGSFYSTTATGSNAPVDGHAFVGICYTSDPPNAAGMPPVAKDLVIEARDQSDTINPGRKYVRERRAGVWGAWRNAERDIYGDAEGFSSEAGDMFFGIKGVAPNSRFIVNSKKDASGTDLINIPKAGGLTVNGNIYTTNELQVGLGSTTIGTIRFSSDTSRFLHFNTSGYTLNGGTLNVSGEITTPATNAGTQRLNVNNYAITDGSNYLLRSGSAIYFQNNAGGTWGYASAGGLAMAAGNISTPGYVMMGGGTSVLYMNGGSANRYLQWDGANYQFGGVSGVYAGGQKLLVAGDLNPALLGTYGSIVNGRLAFAADYSHTSSLQEPYAGAAVTGGAVAFSAMSLRYRWVQLYTTGWFTVGTA